jgi:hypothetical protein
MLSKRPYLLFVGNMCMADIFVADTFCGSKSRGRTLADFLWLGSHRRRCALCHDPSRAEPLLLVEGPCHTCLMPCHGVSM